MSRTLIGAMVSSSPQPAAAQFTRGPGVAQPIAAEEAAMVADGAPAGWHYGASRCHYNFMNEALTVVNSNTKTRISGTSAADFENNRLPVITTKSAGATWAQVATGAEDAFIDARGAELKIWQDAHRGLGKWGATFVWSFHHEPNGDDIAGQGGTNAIASANWIAATTRIYNRWVAQGVTIWDGQADWTTNTEGLVLAVNLVDGRASAANNALSKNFWWGPADGGPGPGNAWMDAHCVMFATDPYPTGQMWPFSNLVSHSPGGPSTGPGLLTNTIRSWADAKRTYQESQGRVFMEGIFETGSRQVPGSGRGTVYTAIPQAWTDTGLAPTEANWIIEMRNYIRDSWPTLNLLCFWDDRASGWYEIDNTAAAWAAAISTFTDEDAYASALTSLSVDQTVTAPLISRVPTLGVPNIFTNRIDVGLINPAPGLFLPNFKMHIAPSLIDQTATLAAPTAGLARTVTASLLDNTATLSAPAVNTAGLTAGLIDDTYTIFAPNIKMGLAPSLLNQTATLSPPAINNGGGVAAVVQPSLIDRTPVLNTPKMNQTINPPLLDYSVGGWGSMPWGNPWGGEGAHLFPLTILGLSSYPLINQTPVLFAPNIGRSIAPSLIDQTAVLYPPTILATTAGQLVEPGLIDQTGATFAPSVAELEIYVIKLNARYTTSVELPASYNLTNHLSSTFDETIRLRAVSTGFVVPTPIPDPVPDPSVIDVVLIPDVDTDQTASAQAQITAAPNGTADDPTIINMPAGRYRMNSALVVANKSHVRLTCPAGSPLVVDTLTGAPRPADDEAFWVYSDAVGHVVNQRAFSIAACTDVIISNVAVDGWRLLRGTGGYAAYGGATYEGEHAFAISNASVDCGYEDCWATNFGGDGCYVGNPISGSGLTVNNVNNHFTRVHTTYAARHCITVVSGDQTTFTDVFGDWAGFDGIDTEPNGDYNTTNDLTFTRVSIGAQKVAVVIQSSGTVTHHTPARYKIDNVTMTDVRVIRTLNGAKSLAIAAGTGDVLIERFIDHTNNNYVVSTMSGSTWTSVTMTDCVMDLRTGGGHTVVTSYGLSCGSGFTLEMTGNQFVGGAGKPVLNLSTRDPATYLHHGNVWGTAAAPLTDGP